jgi:hypothetical protein
MKSDATSARSSYTTSIIAGFAIYWALFLMKSPGRKSAQDFGKGLYVHSRKDRSLLYMKLENMILNALDVSPNLLI